MRALSEVRDDYRRPECLQRRFRGWNKELRKVLGVQAFRREDGFSGVIVVDRLGGRITWKWSVGWLRNGAFFPRLPTRVEALMEYPEGAVGWGFTSEVAER
jgi:hypothetical protein